MKQIKRDPKQAELEAKKANQKQEEAERREEALEQFRTSSAYPYVMEIFEQYENQLYTEVENIQMEEMRKLYMLPLKEQRAKLVEMSKRDSILTGALAIIKRVKRKL